MHLTKAFLFTALLSTLGLATPTHRDGGRDMHGLVESNKEREGSTELFQRDAQAANMVLIKDIVATTGWDMETKEDLTQERIARLAPADAQLLAGEMNKYLINHGRQDTLIPEFTQEDFEKAAKKVTGAAHRKVESDSAVEARTDGADYGVLVEARRTQFLWEFISTLFMDVLFFVLGL